MKLSTIAVKEFISNMGFSALNGKNGVFHKSYNGYLILVDFNEGKIIYDSEYYNTATSAIKVWDKKSSNFSHDENFVVLECVNRLLEKGYSPECIELEKTYPSGHGHSGRPDIFVKRPNGSPFLMIECKTWGDKYEEEKRKMLKNGGQLFSYYSCDRAVEFLCLYSAKIGSIIERKSAVIDVDMTWAGLSGVKEIYEHWNKNFKDNGIFEDCAVPYDIKHKALTYSDLQTLREEDGSKIYNQIMEILRHNAISDKPNAFNKLLNLFVCKIIDENKNPDDELEFQWLETDDDESLQLRLNDLYKEGMWDFLEIDVIDYKQEEVSQMLENIQADENTKKWIMEMYTNTRLKKSPNFAFVEVQDDKTFKLNAKVVREIVELIQVFKFRYEQKHEFLGNFFELLLNTSMKQEAGQFFTPVPITRFIISSLPIKEFVQWRIDSKKGDALPIVIDYACGSGHFLTEYMSQMQKIIDEKLDISKAAPQTRRNFEAWSGYTKFLWAKDTVYGIDLDNRLVKTTKVSAFFNGDGRANIIWANGLDNFVKSDSYRGKLKHARDKDNGQFDILISNPPYSVDSFKNTVEFGEESFELYKYLTDNSSEIECLFVERMKQLLTVGGWAAVVLPSSILTNGSIYARAREILVKYFNIKALVSLGSHTFMKTSTNTVIFFLERRNDNDWVTIMRAIENFISTKKDVTVMGIENAFSTYVSNVYDQLTFEDYISLISGNPSNTAKTYELYKDYVKAYGDDYCSNAVEIEKEKMLYFLLTYNQNIVLVKSGKGKQEKQFLGYKFSQRRGHEGLHTLSCGTKLYDEDKPLNPTKVSSYIYFAFLGKQANVDKGLAQYLSYGRMSGFFEYGTNTFDKKINLGRKTKITSSYPMDSINRLVDIISGVTYDEGDQVYEETNRAILTADNISQEGKIQIVKTIFLKQDLPVDENKCLHKDDVFICMSSGSKEHVGKCAFVENEMSFFAGGFMGILRRKSDNIIMKYLWIVLSSAQYRSLLGQDSTGANINNLGKRIGNVQIPLPPINTQKEIVSKIEDLENNIKRFNKQIAEKQDEIIGIISNCYNSSKSFSRLKEIAQYSSERISAKHLDKNTYIGVDNLLPNLGGKRSSDFVPSSGSTTAYHQNDILLSNIRPYLKKIWLADNDGGSSNDVLILQIDKSKAIPEYIYALIATDKFFDFEMQNIGSNGKMPRADKDKVLDYQIPLPTLDEQQKIVNKISPLKSEIERFKADIDKEDSKKKSIIHNFFG